MCGIPMTPPQDLGKADEKTIERALAHAGANLENQNTALLSEDAKFAIFRQFEDFIWRDKQGDGICSNCGGAVDSRELWMSHKDYTKCPHCAKTVQVRDLRYGHSKLEQEFYAVQWQMEAHDRVVQLRNETRFMRERERNEKRCDGLQGKLDKRLPELEKKYCFEYDGLVLRPAKKLIELIDEGNALGHCVGHYVDSYADGRTDILFLRQKNEPDKPWRTVEFSPTTGRMIQDRGYKNDRMARPGDKCGMTPELRERLDAFWAAYHESRKKRERKSA